MTYITPGMTASFKLARAIRRLASSQPQDTSDSHYVAAFRSNVARQFGQLTFAPSILERELRAAGTVDTTNGAGFINTTSLEAIAKARPASILDQLGARRIAVGYDNATLPVFTAGSVAESSETTAIASGAVNLSSVSLSPRPATAHTVISGQLLLQDDDAPLLQVVADLNRAADDFIQQQAFAAILSAVTSNVYESSTGTTAVPFTSSTALSMLEDVFAGGGAVEQCSYVLSPLGFTTYNSIANDQEVNTRRLHGSSVFASASLPNGTDENVSGSPTVERVIAGDFNRGLVVVDYGGINVRVNRYGDEEGATTVDLDMSDEVRVVVRKYFDVAVTHESCFAVYKEQPATP